MFQISHSTHKVTCRYALFSKKVHFFRKIKTSRYFWPWSRLFCFFPLTEGIYYRHNSFSLVYRCIYMNTMSSRFTDDSWYKLLLFTFISHLNRNKMNKRRGISLGYHLNVLADNFKTLGQKSCTNSIRKTTGPVA